MKLRVPNPKILCYHCGNYWGQKPGKDSKFTAATCDGCGLWGSTLPTAEYGVVFMMPEVRPGFLSAA